MTGRDAPPRLVGGPGSGSLPLTNTAETSPKARTGEVDKPSAEYRADAEGNHAEAIAELRRRLLATRLSGV